MLSHLSVGLVPLLVIHARLTKSEQGQLCFTTDNTRFHHSAKQLLILKKQAKIGFNPSVFSGIHMSCRVQADMLRV